MAQWVRELVPQVEVWVFESQPQRTYVVKAGSDSSTAKRSAIGVSVTDPRSDHYKWMPLVEVGMEPSLLNGHKCRA